MNDDRALLRALRVERATNKLYSKRLRALMTPDAYPDFKQFCRVTVHAGCESSKPADDDQVVAGTP